MENKFLKVMSQRTDEQLIKIVTIDRDGYEPLAVEAAEYEIKIRNIDISKIDEVKIDLASKLEKQRELDYKRVNSIMRLVHFIVDTTSFLILTWILLTIAGFIFNTNDPDNWQLIGTLTLIISFFTYYIFMEYNFQKTLGKFLTKTKVVVLDGSKPEFNEIVRRTICRLIPLDRISFILTRNGLHDYLSNTMVIND